MANRVLGIYALAAAGWGIGSAGINVYQEGARTYKMYMRHPTSEVNHLDLVANVSWALTAGLGSGLIWPVHMPCKLFTLIIKAKQAEQNGANA